jgi:protocatechuate 3,4-dioxygenase beta subunit
MTINPLPDPRVLPSYQRPAPGVHPPPDGAGEPVAEAMLETWQTDPDGVAQPGRPGEFRFDIWRQGNRETVFFDV